ncbi:MAG: T9SS type A sorting domain-containing protein [Bacteroidota bacterium]
MKNHLHFLLLFIPFFSSPIIAQGWFKTYDATLLNDFATDVVQTPDGGYALCGNSREFVNSTAGINNLFILKTGPDGTPQWTQVPDPQNKQRVVSKILLRTDGTLAIAADDRIWRLNMNGDLLSIGGDTWPNSGLYDLIETFDGGFASAGSTVVNQGQTSADEQATMATYDSLANFLTGFWGGFGDDENTDMGISIVEMTPGDFRILRTSIEWTGNNWYSEVFVEAINADGILTNSTFLHDEDDFVFTGSLIKTADGNLVAGTIVNNKFHLNKIGFWTRTIGSFDETYQAFAGTADGGFILAGHSYLNSVNRILLIKLDEDGNTEWRKILPYQLDQVTSIKETSDAGFILTGQDSSPSGLWEVFLLKTDSLGNVAPNLQGFVKRDEDGDCQADTGEPPLSNWIVEVEGNSGTFYGTSDVNGQYSIEVPPGDYSVRLQHPAINLWNVCNNQIPVTIDSASTIVNLDMAESPLIECPLLDISIQTNFIRRCVANTYTLHYCNHGTGIADDATVSVTIDEYLIPLSASVPFTINGNNLQLSLGDVDVGECGSVSIEVVHQCGAPFDELICVTANVTNVPVNCTLGSNSGISFSDFDCQVAIGPYDPNDKSAVPVGAGPDHEIPNDTTITYLIRFQNTGTDTAFQVVLRDTLSANLEIGSLRPGASSHAYDWELSGNGELKFTFDNIMLPDSNINEAASHGFVSFKIKPKTPLVPGTVIENKAAIYFDFNEPIITNTVFHTIEKPMHFGNAYFSGCQGDEFQGIALTVDTTVYDTLQFTWYDSVTITTIEVFETVETLSSATICDGETVQFYGHILNQTGVYQTVLSSVNGCDSTITLTLEVLPNEHTQLSAQICESESYDFNGQLIDQAGEYQAVLSSYTGCDSTVTLNLEVLPNEHTQLSAQICESESYDFNGQLIDQTGEYQAVLTSHTGCDSIVTLDLDVQPNNFVQINEQICEGESFLYEGVAFNQTGVYEFEYTNVAGCDSLVILSLEILPAFETQLQTTICAGTVLDFYGEILDSPGTYQHILSAQNGCDSLISLTLEKLENSTYSFSATICEGEDLLFNGQLLTEAGIYQHIATAANGCDSTTILTLEVLPRKYAALAAVFCEGSSFEYDGEILNQPGLYTFTLTSHNGCDSIVTLTLTTNPSFFVMMDTMLLPGESIFGVPIFSDTSFVQHFLTTAGCDSLIQVNASLLVGTNDFRQNELTRNIFPNPGKDQIFIDFELGNSKVMGIEAVDIYGRKINTVLPTRLVPSGSHRLELTTKDWAAGVYFIIFRMENQTMAERLILKK